MLHYLTYLLFKLNLIQPSERTIHFWTQDLLIEKLKYALEHGKNRTRKLADEALEHVGKSSSTPVLLKAISDKVQNVSIAALNALEKIGSEDRLVNTIISKRFIWASQTREKKAKFEEANKNKTYKIYRWERASKKSFERVKQTATKKTNTLNKTLKFVF